VLGDQHEGIGHGDLLGACVGAAIHYRPLGRL
jgi:hypothetical protein